MKTVLRGLWEWWKDLTHYIGEFQSRLLLTLFYFTVLVPFGIITRLFVDPLGLRNAPKSSGWLPRKAESIDLNASRQQF